MGQGFYCPPVYWLNGLAGTGKSTMAHSVAEHTFADRRLGASFFCSRDFEDRRDLRYIFLTLAFQLACAYPTFRSTLVPLLQSNPDGNLNCWTPHFIGHLNSHNH